jgi:hypothetical protein
VVDLAVKHLKRATSVNAALWAESCLKLNSRTRFSFDKHLYQIEPMTIKAPRVTWIKSTQMGITHIMIYMALHGLRFEHFPQGVIYMVPSKGKAERMSKSRISTAIEYNPLAIGRHCKSTNTVLLKRIKDAWLYVLWGTLNVSINGMERESEALRGDPADCVFCDESDLMDQTAIGKAQERMGHSDVKRIYDVSNPTVPGYGVDAAFEESDQRHWMVRCTACNHWSCLELEFPDCVQVDVNGIAHRVCIKCGGVLDIDQAEWVAKFPDRSANHVGYWISQLNSHFVDPGKILSHFHNPPLGMTLSDVYRLELGRAHVSAQEALTKEMVLSCCRDYYPVNRSTSYTAIGIDVRPDCLDFVCIQRADSQGAVRLLCVREFVGKTMWNDAAELARNLNAQCQVVDVRPETGMARRYAERASGEVWLCEYNDAAGGVHFDQKSGLVKANRTELLDNTHYLVDTPGQLTLPYPTDMIQQFAVEMTNLVKMNKEDPATGKMKSLYIKRGPDHKRHALGYALLASLRCGIVPQGQNGPAPVTVKRDYDID